MIKHTSSNFTLVEIALAMVVITVGLVSVLGLFPVGTNASRDAIGQTYAAETADMFLKTFENKFRSNWSTMVDNYSSHNKKIYADEDSLSWTDSELKTEFNQLDAPMTNIYAHKIESVLYRVTSSTEINNKDITDFDGIIRVWFKKVEVAGNTISYDNAVKIYCEISWPVREKYGNRKKETYCLELFKR